MINIFSKNSWVLRGTAGLEFMDSCIPRFAWKWSFASHTVLSHKISSFELTEEKTWWLHLIPRWHMLPPSPYLPFSHFNLCVCGESRYGHPWRHMWRTEIDFYYFPYCSPPLFFWTWSFSELDLIFSERLDGFCALRICLCVDPTMPEL